MVFLLSRLETFIEIIITQIIVKRKATTFSITLEKNFKTLDKKLLTVSKSTFFGHKLAPSVIDLTVV